MAMILASTSMQCVGGKEAFSSAFFSLEEEKSPCGFFLTNLIIFLFRCFTSLIFDHTDPTHGRRMSLGLAVVAVRTRVRMSFPRTMGRLSCRPIVSSLVVVIQRTRALCTRRSFSGLTRGSHSQESHFARHTNPRNSPFQTNTRRTKAHQTCEGTMATTGIRSCLPRILRTRRTDFARSTIEQQQQMHFCHDHDTGTIHNSLPIDCRTDSVRSNYPRISPLRSPGLLFVGSHCH